MNAPIESAADLHREIAKRGLELRPEVGRDAALITDLAKKLGITPTRFISTLETTGKSAEEYLRALMFVAEPFARMFREIWIYLARYCAPKATESLVIRFGFEGDNKEIDWDQFRVFAQTAKKIRSFGPVILWPDKELFELARILTEHLPRHNRRYPRYNPGQPFGLLPFEVVEPIDEIGNSAREIIQSLIDEIHSAWPAENADENTSDEWADLETKTSRNLPELEIPTQTDEVEPFIRKRSTRDLAFLLTDLIPSWGDICQFWSAIPMSDKQKAEQYFRQRVEPFLKSAQAPAWRRVQEALDLLDLPFWRYRWHTYEVWASVKALEALAEFHPQPVVKNGHIALDASIPALVAKLAGEKPIYVHVQGETKLMEPLGKRKAIKPDLRFSLDDPARNETTITIVEYKQRHELDSKHVLEVLKAYALGVGLGGGVVLINYDAIPQIAAPPHCCLLGHVHPGQPDNVLEYQRAVRNSFTQAGIIPRASKRFVLLDVSSSMASKYTSKHAQNGLRRLVACPWLKIFRFNDGLVCGGDFKINGIIATSGGTALGAALEQLFSLPDAGIPERLIIVTDGEHDHPDELLAKCSSCLECMPEDLEIKLDWLLED